MPQDHALCLRADPVPDALGRARSLLYKPAELNLVIADGQRHETSWRLLPRVARDGFLLVPTLAHAEDLEALIRGVSSSRVTAIRFEAPGDQGEFWSHVDVHIFSLPSLPLSRPSDRWLQELGIIDRTTASIESVAPPVVFDLPEGNALLLHAPGQIKFQRPIGAVRFSGNFGIKRGAYTGEGHTAGVDFEVLLVRPDGGEVALWRRYLDPVARAEDRGMQRFVVDLPAGMQGVVALRTRAGPSQDNRWGWSYVSGLRFEAQASE
jgi:hypothetical protein